MKIAGLILGIVGSLAGFAGSLFALSVGGLGAAFKVEGPHTIFNKKLPGFAGEFHSYFGRKLILRW